MKWNLSLPKSPMPIYYLAKLYGLAPITPRNGIFYPGTFLDKLYPLTLAGFYLLIIAFQLFGSTTYSDKIVVLNPLRLFYLTFYLNVCRFTSIIISMTSLITCDKIVWILNKLRSVIVEQKNFGIQEDVGIFFRQIFKITILVNGIIFVIFTIRIYFGEPINLFSISISLHNFIVMNVMLIYCCIMFCIKCRFQFVNEKLANIFEKGNRQKSFPGQRKRNTVLILDDDLRDQRGGNDYDKLTDLECIRKIEKLHDELCDLMEETTFVFGLPIVMFVFETFLYIVGKCHIIYQLLSLRNGSAENPVASTSIIALFQLVNIVLHSTMLFSISNVCETTCEQGNSTKLVLSQVWNKFKPVELENEFVLFSLQLQHGQLEICACGFFHLNNSTLYKVYCTVITYVILIIQFDTP